MGAAVMESRPAVQGIRGWRCGARTAARPRRRATPGGRLTTCASAAEPAEAAAAQPKPTRRRLAHPGPGRSKRWLGVSARSRNAAKPRLYRSYEGRAICLPRRGQFSVPPKRDMPGEVPEGRQTRDYLAVETWQRQL